jgi:myo-inositol 2-dehydrogenase/D-chiro-inositol 1-dehydrogenase
MIMHRFAIVGAGFIGSVHAANLANRPGIDFTPGGQMRDQTVHFFDLARWICG